MLRRNPLAALSLQQPSLRTPSLKLADDMPFELDKEEDGDSPDGVYMQPNSALCFSTPIVPMGRSVEHDLMLCCYAMQKHPWCFAVAHLKVVAV